MKAEIEARKVRNPLLTEGGWHMFRHIHDHRHAPAWNYTVGDRLIAEDLPGIEHYRSRIEQRPLWSPEPPEWLIDWTLRLRDRVPLFRQRLPEGFNLRRDWVYLPTSSREDIALHIERLVPLDADLERLIVYETNGTSTGHALDVPNHPCAVAKNHPLLEHALHRHGVSPRFDDRHVACINVGAEAGTVMFPNVFAVWNNAGFAKVNLHSAVWDEERARGFFSNLSPELLTGDPVAFHELVHWGVDYRPKALVSTATTLPNALKERLQERYHCPVIDFYSTTETGPIAYSAPTGDGFSQLAPDVYIEILDAEGFPTPQGEMGEITVSGGRNPYLPLLRYRTGDFARLQPRGTAADPAPRLLDLQARKPVRFQSVTGSYIHPLDIAKSLHRHLWVQHELIQGSDGSLHLTIRPFLGVPLDQQSLKDNLRRLFGEIPVTIIEDPTLGVDRAGGKVIAYHSELSPGVD